jgi:hypothetical protein
MAPHGYSRDTGRRGFSTQIRRWRAFPQFTALFGVNAPARELPSLLRPVGTLASTAPRHRADVASPAAIACPSMSMQQRGAGAGGRPGEWAGMVIPADEVAALLARFGMMVGLDTSPGADHAFQSAQLAHALVGAAEAHATRAEQAYRDAGAHPPDITQASLMAFAAVNCQNEVDKVALISWRPPGWPGC